MAFRLPSTVVAHTSYRLCCWYREKSDAPGAVADPHLFPIAQKRNSNNA